MGKEARRSAELRLQAGIIPIRIGRKSAKARKAEARKKEQATRVFLPVGKKEAPLEKAELELAFGKAHQARAEVAAGVRAAGPVDLAEVGLEPMSPDVAKLVLDVAQASTRTRVVPGRGRVVDATVVDEPLTRLDDPPATFDRMIGMWTDQEHYAEERAKWDAANPGNAGLLR